MSGLLLPPGIHEASVLSRQKDRLETELRSLAGEWTQFLVDDCDEAAMPCMDCYRSLKRGERRAFTPTLLARYGDYASLMKAMKFRCKDGCKPRGVE